MLWVNNQDIRIYVADIGMDGPGTRSYQSISHGGSQGFPYSPLGWGMLVVPWVWGGLIK
jgi:hypothetical protein